MAKNKEMDALMDSVPDKKDPPKEVMDKMDPIMKKAGKCFAEKTK